MTKELKNRILENKVLTHDERMEIIKALEQSSEDCVSRADLLKLYEDRFIELQKAHQTDKQLGVNWCINTLKELPPVIPTHGTCKECKYSSVHTISLDKIDEIRVCRIQFSKQIKDDYYCANYEKRGNENEIN